jgi:broad specificity phosphatase PhoE
LSQEGIELARLVGNGSGPFDRVITSTAPRAFETAIAMGFAVHEQRPLIEMIPVDMELPWDVGFSRLAAYIREQPRSRVARGAAELGALLRSVAEAAAAGQRVLIVSHGGVVEMATVGAFPTGDYAKWTRPVSYCKGAELEFDGNNWTRVSFLPAPVWE